MNAGRPREFDRDEVLNKAMELFWAQGYGATGVTELTDHLGIARQSLYRTFGDKRALFIEALRNFGKIALAQYQSKLSGVADPIERLKVIFDVWHGRVDDDSHDGCGCFLGNAMIEFGDADPEITQIAEECLGKLQDLLNKEIRAAKEAGFLSKEAEPRKLAHWLVSQLEGMALMTRSKRPKSSYHSLLDTCWKLLLKA